MRRDSAGNYLTRLIAAARRLKGRWRRRTLRDLIDFDLIGDPDLRRLRPNIDPQENQSLRAAFEAFEDLDPSEPEDWRLLLALFAEAYFVPSRARGGTRQWDGSRLCQLLADFAVVKKKKGNQELKDGKICELVKTTFPKRYRDVTAVTIRRRLQDARDPTQNEILGDVLNGLLPLDPRGMTAEQRRDLVVKLISQRWGRRIRRRSKQWKPR
jgi:hypothetical protein